MFYYIQMGNDCSPHLWQLKFNPAMINDSGTYLCHISTDPPLIRYIHLEISGNIWFIFKLLALPQPRLWWCTTTHPHHRKFIQNPEHNFVRYRLFHPRNFIYHPPLRRLDTSASKKWKWKFNGKKGISPSIFVGNFQFRLSSRPSRLSRSVLPIYRREFDPWMDDEGNHTS